VPQRPPRRGGLWRAVGSCIWLRPEHAGQVTTARRPAAPCWCPPACASHRTSRRACPIAWCRRAMILGEQGFARQSAEGTRPGSKSGARAHMLHLDDAGRGGSGASGDGQRLPPARRAGFLALEACEDVVLVVDGRSHVRVPQVDVGHRFPELRLLCVDFETPTCLPLPDRSFAWASFGFVLPPAVLLLP